MKLSPKLTLSSNLTAEDLIGMPEITMDSAVDERPVCLATHKVGVGTVGGFEFRTTRVIE